MNSRQMTVAVTLIVGLLLLATIRIAVDAVHRGDRAKAQEQLECIRALGEQPEGLSVLACKGEL